MRNYSPFAPLPGTDRPTKALFIDRWGTLFSATESGQCQDPAELCFTPGSIDALFRASQAGWQIYLIGNEDAVAFGRMQQSTWEKLEQGIISQLADQGVQIVRNYACLDDLEGVKPHNRVSVFQLPNTGIFYHASQEDGIDLLSSWVVGDGALELAAGDRAQCRLAMVRRELTGLSGDASSGDGTEQPYVEAEIVGPSLAEVVDELLAADPLKHH